MAEAEVMADDKKSARSSEENAPMRQKISHTGQKIAPCLWFDGNAEEAARFYTSIFKNSAIQDIGYYGDAGPGPKGSVMIVKFTLEGQEFLALNGGPQFRFSEAISFVIHCASQEEVDEFWEKLSDGGKTQPCGWLKDKFGLSWQVVPTKVVELLQAKDARKAAAVMSAVMQMEKIDIARAKAAFEQA